MTYSDNFEKRKQRVRKKIVDVSKGKLRLSVFRSKRHIYAQLIDDLKGETIVSASTVEKELKKQKLTLSKESAALVGKKIAERAIEKGKSIVVFDRGGYIYHGRVKALADAAREAGLKF